MEQLPSPVSPEPEKKDYTPEEIKKMNAQRGSFVSGAARKGEMEKNPEDGAWDVTSTPEGEVTPEGAGLLEKARNEMETDFAAREKAKKDEIKKLNAQRGGYVSQMKRRGEMVKNEETGEWEAVNTDKGDVLIERARKEMEEDLASRPKSGEAAAQPEIIKPETEQQEAKKEESPAAPERQWQFTDKELDVMKSDSERAQARYENMLKVSREAGLQDVHVENYKWIADEKKKIYERALETVYPEAKPIGEGGQEAFQKSYEKESKKRVWPWIKERVKGVATLGFWELHQAEKFRASRKNVESAVSSRAQFLHYLEDVDINTAWVEAQEIQRRAGKNAEASAYEKASNEITSGQKAENDKIISALLVDAEGQLVKKLGASRVFGKNMFEYRSASGERVLTEEKLGALREDLEKKLRSYQSGTVARDWKELRKIVEQKLDPNYWSRYIYAGAEAVIGFLGYKMLLTHALSGLGTKVAAKEGAVAAKEAVVAMQDHIWNTSRILLEQNGVMDPSNSKIMEVAKQICIDNGIGVKEWGLSGNPLDTQMTQGYLLKAGGALKKIMLLRSSIPI